MENGEVELQDQILLLNSDSSNKIQASMSIDSFLDGFLKNTQTCTHTHTCNPPGPATAAHTHTCYHTHTQTQVLPSEDDDISAAKPRRSLGNREAVRKYREKKKAHAAYLEEEVKKLRLVNQQLLRKLQGQDVLEAEILRLRGILIDLRGKIDNEMGVFPLQKQCNSTTNGTLKEGNCGLQSNDGGRGLSCEVDLPCFHTNGDSGKMGVSWEGNCESAIVDCQADRNDIASAEVCGMLSSVPQAE